MDINDIKAKLSGAYLQAITAKLDLSFQESGRSFDNDGIDYQIKQKAVGGLNSVLNIQLKGVSESSTSMYKEVDDSIRYNLTKNYDNLPYPSFLVLVVFPDEADLEKWCKIDPEYLLVKKCAYYIELPQKTGFITIPKSNLLNESSLMSLFISSPEEVTKSL